MPSLFEAYGIEQEELAPPANTKPSKTSRSVLTAANDTVIEGANAFLSGVQGIGNFFSPGNRFSGMLGGLIEKGNQSQSDVVKAEKLRLQQETEAADGVLGEIAPTLGYVARNPLISMAQVAGSVATPGLAVKGLSKGAQVFGLGEKAASRAGLVGGSAIGGAMAGGDAAGTAYELVTKTPIDVLAKSPEYQALAEQGMDQASIVDALATQAANNARVIPGLLGAASGAIGFERLLAGGKGFAGGALKRGAKAGVVEAVPEGIEEGATTFEGQAAAAKYNPTINPLKGVGSAATMGAVMGLASGGAIGALTPEPTTPSAGDLIRRNLQPETGALAKAVNAGIEAQAQQADATGVLPGAELVSEPEPIDDPFRDRITALPEGPKQEALRAYAVVNNPDAPKGVLNYNRGLLDRLLRENEEARAAAAEAEAATAPLAPPTDTDVTGLLGPVNADPLSGALEAVKSEAAANENLANWMQRATPYPVERAQELQALAMEQRGLDMAVVPHSSGSGFTVIPAQWVTPAMRNLVGGALPFDNAPTGAIRVNTQGTAAPETRPQQLATAAENQRRTDLGLPITTRAEQGAADVSPAAPVAAVDTGLAGSANLVPTGSDGVGALPADDRADGVLPVAGTPAPSSEPGVAVGTALTGNSLTNGEVDGAQADQAQQTETQRPEAPAAVEPLASITRADGLTDSQENPVVGGIETAQEATNNIASNAPAAVEVTTPDQVANQEAPGTQGVLLSRKADTDPAKRYYKKMREILDRREEGGDPSTLDAEAAAAKAEFDAARAVAPMKLETLDSGRQVPLTVRVRNALISAKQKFAGKQVTNASDGLAIEIPASGLKHAMSGKVSEAALAALDKVDELVRTAKFSHATPDKKGRNTIKEVRFYDREAVLDGKPVNLRVVVRVAPDGRRYYDHFEIKEKAPAGLSGKRDEPDSAQPFTEVSSLDSLTDSGIGALQSSRPESPPDDRGPLLFSREARNELGQFAGKTRTIRQIVQVVTSRWDNPPGIEVISSLSDAPGEVIAEYERQNSQGADGEAEGFYHRGKVYLVASALNTPADVTRVLFHETLGHAGLRGNFDGVLEPILDQIATLRGDLLRPVAEKYGFNLSDRGDRLKAAEEVLAFLAQTKPEIGYVKRAIAAIRTWLRANIPGFAAMKLSDAEIVNNFILPARQFVERGTQKPERTPELQPAFGRREQLAVQLAPAIVGGNLGSASALPMYEAAKAGDVVAAVDVAKALVTPDLTEKVRRAIGAERPVVVPVASVEAAGRNKIPLAAAKVLAKELGLKTADGLVQSNSPKRTALNGLDRIFAQPEFDGQVEPGQSYVLVDDTLTQGATFAALASHIQQNGGRVLASVALTGKTYSATLTPNPETLKRLREKYADLEPQFQAATGFGFDGLTQSEARYLANFEPTQAVRDRIVEAGNQAGYGQNPADAGPVNEPGLPPVFSRTADSAGAQSVAATKTDPKAVLNEALTRTGGALANRLDLALNLLTRRQIVDVYEKDIPELKNYSTLVQRMDADKNEVGAQADQLADRWGKLRDEKPLAELMHDATLARTDPDLPFVERAEEKPLERRSRLVEHKALADRFNALSDGAKAVYRETRDAYRVQYDNIKEAIRENIERAIKDEPTRLKFLDRLDTEFFKDIQGVYFPLARFGDYLVNVRDAEGTIIAHHRAETLSEANHLRAQLMAQGKTLGWDVGKVLKSKEFNARRDLAGKGFIKEIMDTLKTSGVDGNVIDSVAQLYLQSLPDLSWAKHGIHRKGTAGFSQDARRAFASNMFFGARYLAKLRYNDKLLDSLATMQEQVDSGAYNDGYDSVAAQKVVDHMNKRHDSLMNPDTNPVSTALTSIGFIFHLGLSPASAMVNLSQTALVAFPIMGAKWGYAKASAALLSASKLVAVSKNDLSKALTGDEKAAYEQAVKDGTIDVTQAHDLAGIAQGEDSKVAWKIRPVMKWASFLFHHAERFNRQVTFVASYRLAREAGTAHEQAVEEATKATIDGHFDYSASNRAKAMQGNVARVVLLFKQYSQNMIFTLSRQAFLAMKGQTPDERTEARKALGGLLAMHAAAAGGLGLPIVSSLLAAASFLGGDDDEPWNAEVAMKNTLADTFGPKAAEVMAHGLSRLTPWDISGRVGLDKLLFPDIQEGLDGGRWFESAATAALGPVVGIGLNALKGLQDVSEGRTVRGLEAMMPTALRGPLKAYRYATEGNVDRTGVVINDEVSLSGIAGQAAGFSPSETRAAQEVRSAIYSHDNALVERRKSLMNQYAMAKMAGDEEGAQEVREMINGFNEKNPARRIKPVQLIQSVRRRQQRIDSAEEGVYLPKNRRDSISAVRFGEVAEAP